MLMFTALAGSALAVLDPETPPDMQVYESNNLLSSESSINFGTAARNQTSAPKTFSFFNGGEYDLVITSLGFFGGNTGDFVLGSVSLPLEVPAFEVRTVTVSPRPVASGTRSTNLRIISNHGGPPGAVLLIPLTANSVTGTQINFTNAEYKVGQAAGKATVTLSRKSAALAQSIRFRTQNGTDSTAMPFYLGAVAGTDYTERNIVVPFGVGVFTRTMEVNIPNLGSAPNRRFTVSLSEPTGGASLGALTNATVQILSTDTLKPTLLVTSPATTDTAFDAQENPQVAVEGTVADAKGLSQVTLSLNGKAAYAIPVTTEYGFEGTFSVLISPDLGLNSLILRAYDVKGNMTIVTRSFNYTGGVGLTIQRAVPTGTGNPSNAGTVTVVADPVKHVSKLVVGAKPTYLQTGKAVAGAQITVKAAAKAGYAFSAFSGLPYGASVVGSVATFVMPETALALTATFIAQPFAGATGSSGVFSGIIRKGSMEFPTAPDDFGTAATTGAVTATLTTNGLLTGTIKMNEMSQAFKALVHGDGSVVFISGTTQSAALTMGTYSVTMEYNTFAKNYINVSVVNTTLSGTTNSSGYLVRGFYSASRKVLLAKRGYYTAFIGFSDDGFGGPSAIRSSGYATFTVSETGTATISVTLPDGAVGTSSSLLVNPDGNGSSWFPVHLTVAVPGAASSAAKSVISGWMHLPNLTGGTESHDVWADLVWHRPATGSSLYPSGWTAGKRLYGAGSKLNRSETLQQKLGITGSTLSGNAILRFSGGKLVDEGGSSSGDFGSVTVTAFNIIGNTITKLTPGDASFTLTYTPATGLFSGSFTPNWASPSTTKPVFKGVLIDQSFGPESGAGIGAFISNIQGDSAPALGEVMLIKQPEPVIP